MGTLVTTGSGAFPWTIPPITNITPFTYRDGASYLEILYGLRDYITGTLEPKFVLDIERIIADFNAGLSSWETKFNDFIDEVTAEIAVLNDNAVANLLTAPASVTRQALDKINDLNAGDGYKYAVLAGVIRNNGVDPVYWEILENGHRAVNIDSVETWADKIRVNYHSLGAVMTISLLAVPDETLSRNGFSTGCSVGPETADIYIQRTTPVLGDYVSYDGTDWVSQNGVFTDMSFSGGILYLTHAPVDAETVYNVNITARGGGYVYAVGRGSSPTTTTTLKVDIRDMAGVSVTEPTTDLAMYITRGGGIHQQAPKTVDTIKYPFSNIWIYGIMGLDRDDQ